MDIEKHKIELANRIEKFLEKYAKTRPQDEDEDEEEPQYNGPDPYQLLVCAKDLREGKKIMRCFSEWGSGCYSPYSSKEGREEHNYLVAEVYKIINSSK